MTNRFIFTKYAEKKFLKLDSDVQRRVTLKLTDLKEYDQIDTLLKVLVNMEPRRYRLRIASYRLILKRLSTTDFLVVDLGDRKDIYR